LSDNFQCPCDAINTFPGKVPAFIAASFLVCLCLRVPSGVASPQGEEMFKGRKCFDFRGKIVLCFRHHLSKHSMTINARIFLGKAPLPTPLRAPQAFTGVGESCACFRNNYTYFDHHVILYGEKFDKSVAFCFK